MNKIAIVYWSGTGNTEMMAQAIEEGVKEAGGAAELVQSGEFCVGRLNDYQAFAFGCPAMGDEVLEEGEFAPMFESLENDLAGRKLALFGSYGWGDGEWMRNWVSLCKEKGAVLLQEEGLMANEEPDDDAKEACKALGRELAVW